MRFISIRVESFNLELLKDTCLKLDSLKKKFNSSKVIDLLKISTICLPTTIRVCCVLTSPHIDKDAREHFEIRTHKRLIRIYYKENIIKKEDIFSSLSKLNLSSGVSLQIDSSLL